MPCGCSRGTRENGGSEGTQVASIASPSPVGSAKFGPRVGAKVVGARVGGLVSPTLVGAGVPVGMRVGAAHTIACVIYSDRTAAAVRAEHWARALLRTRYPAGHERFV